MTNRFRVSAAVLAAIVGSVTASANAEVIATLSYHDLAGSYVQSANPNVGQFSAVAVNTALLASAYEASRLTPAAGSASFEAGFVTNPLNPADFQLTISVNKISATAATGAGSFTATDADGDTITGNISGVWTFGGPGFIFFNANISNVLFNDLNAADGTFDGSEGGDFASAFIAPTPYVGSLVQLVFGQNNFFRNSFQDRATGGSLQIIPSPGSVALVGLSGLVLVGRRRSR